MNDEKMICRITWKLWHGPVSGWVTQSEKTIAVKSERGARQAARMFSGARLVEETHPRYGAVAGDYEFLRWAQTSEPNIPTQTRWHRCCR